VLKETILDIVARMSSRVFLGSELCRNPAWLRITVDYTVNAFFAAADIRLWPKPLRSIVHWFLPSCQKLRAQLQEARRIITPVIEKRRAERKALMIDGKSHTERSSDAIAWMEEVAKGRHYDPAVAQLSFSLAAIHTTTDMLTQVIFDLCGKEDLMQSMREEIIAVIGTDGWKKSSLYKLKLMDSVLKESQRLKPVGIGKLKPGQKPTSFVFVIPH
jgi:cytochrome P450